MRAHAMLKPGSPQGVLPACLVYILHMGLTPRKRLISDLFWWRAPSLVSALAGW